ncbi:hypothetical protein [Aneurinibacillus migulanus]|uniref:hypothetical protein n=1 Tax=Aneurinibacillus migulanus TaxID=47500 RepID=UPI001F24DE2A|nr:hypothetical protein [Aneurinibacillus migulanus]
MIHRQILVVRDKKRRTIEEVRKRHIRLFSARAQGVSTLFFLHLSYFQPHYHVKILTVTYIEKIYSLYNHSKKEGLIFIVLVVIFFLILGC